jgi:hypothetical protein
MEAIWRRLNDVKLELPQELVVLMTLMGLPPSFGTQRRILESRKDLSMDCFKKDLRQEALRLKAEQAEQPQGSLGINLTREDSRRPKQKKSGASTAQGLRQHTLLRAAGTNLDILTLGGSEHVSTTFLQRSKMPKPLPKNGKQTMRVCDSCH